jgi:hypothetical protein
MGRIFWQFFAAIWLTIFAAIAFITLANSYLKVLPPKGGMLQSQRWQAFDTVSLLIAQGEIETARTYVAILAQVHEPTPGKAMSPPGDFGDAQPAQMREPMQVTITPAPDLMDEAACKGESRTQRMIFDAKNRRCYLVEVPELQLSFIESYAPAMLPPAAMFLTSIVSAYVLTRYLARPVIALRSGLSALASGNFTARVGSRRGWWNDGITALGHDFDVTADKLEALQENQKQLFHDVSHELRSPLSRMQAALGLVRKSPTKMDAILPRMEREIERLDGLVEQILTLARLRTPDNFIIERQTVDILDLVAVIIDDATFEAEARNISIDFEGAETFVMQVNGELIYRAIENVVRNAVKYSDDGSVISIKAKTAGSDMLDLSIHNHGPFVAPDDVDRLFDPFTRLNASDSVSGHGLGMAITRRAIEAHGGSVSAMSNTNGGLTVLLHLSRSPERAGV